MQRESQFHKSPSFTPDPTLTNDLIKVVNQDDPSLGYQIFVPKGWLRASKLGPYPANVMNPLPFAAFMESGNRHERALVITSTQLPIEVRLEDWIKRLRQGGGWTVYDQLWHQEDLEPRLITWSKRQNNTKVTVARVDAGRVYAVECIAPSYDHQTLRDLVWNSAIPASPLKPDTRPELERRKSIERPMFTFEVPSSWFEKIQPHQQSGQFHLLDQQRRRRAEFHLRVIHGKENQTPKDRLVAGLKALEKVGIRLLSRESYWNGTWLHRPAWWEQTMDLQVGLPGGDIADVRIGVGQWKDCSITMMVLGHRSDALRWMRAERCLEIAAESLCLRNLPV